MMGRRESVIALIILLAAGVFFRSLSHGEDTPLHHSLATFPLQIGPWVGEVHTLEPNVLQVLKVDDYLWRQYGGNARSASWPLYWLLPEHAAGRDLPFPEELSPRQRLVLRGNRQNPFAGHGWPRTARGD